MPLLLLIVFGIIQWGLYFWAMQGGSDIARDAARRAAVSDPAYADCADFKANITEDIEALVGTGAAPAISRVYDQTNGTDPAQVEVGEQVTVTVVFKSIDLHIPLVPMVKDGKVTSTADARVDYVESDPAKMPDVLCP